MAAVPTLLRSVLKSAMPDTNWPNTQVAPDAADLANVAGAVSVGVVFIGRDVAGAVVATAGTVDLQPVTIATSRALPDKGVAAEVIVTGGATNDNVAAGIGVEYATRGAALFTVRVADNGGNLAVGVVSIDIYWHAIS